ncbi:MAG: HAD family phosphatase [Phycisphaerae bacterium]|nr:HAD family phosphatase [Phycisphaerae bacterium]
MTGLYGLILDVDGVIADTEAINARASIAMFEESFGLKGMVRTDFDKGLGRGAAAYVRAAAEVHGLELTDAQVSAATEMRQEKFLAMLNEQPLPPFEGVLELMQEAMSRPDFRVAIATSSTREKSEAVLQSAKVPYREITYITGSDVARKKPDPELFLTAALRAGVDPVRCVVIEDAPDGVAAAKAAGARCIAVTNSTTADKLAQADWIVASLAEVDVDSVLKLIEQSERRTGRK